MPDQFLHGVEVVEVDTGIRPIRTVRSSVIGIVGTAPEADEEAFPYDTPVLIAGSRREAAPLGSAGTLPFAIDGIFDHVGAMVVAVRVPTGARGEVRTRSQGLIDDVRNRIKEADDSRESIAERIAERFSDRREDRNERREERGRRGFGLIERMRNRITDRGDRRLLDRLGSFIDRDDLDNNQVISNIIGGVDTRTGKRLGVQALLDAEAVTGLQPKIIISPGYTQNVAVTSEMLGVADRLRGVIVADGPNTNDQDVIQFRRNFGSARVYIVDPWVNVWDTGINGEIAEPVSARVAGVIAKSDDERGFWWSPSNREIYGVTGTFREIDFTLGDYNSRANYLNENEVTTIIRADGFRLWGNRTCSSDPRWAFLSVRRTADMLNESLLRAHLWAVDRNITRTYVEEVTGSVNDYIRSLVARGAILGGRCYADPDLNTPGNIMDGKIYFDFDFTPPYPAEHVIFRSHLVDDYIDEIFVQPN